jgi:transposase
MWFVGIDWADQHHDVVILSATGERVGQRRVAHSAAGLEELTSWLLDLSPCREEVVCVVETSQGLLVTGLLEAGVQVAPVNPVTVARFRPVSGVKTDLRDALLLARYARTQWPELPLLHPDSPLLQELKALTRDVERLIEQQASVVNQLTSCLKQYYPAALGCFDKLTHQVALSFLEHYPTPEVAAQASVIELLEFLSAVHYPRPLPGLLKKAQQLATVLQAPHLAATPAVARAKARLMQALRAQLCLLKEQIASYDAAIAELFAQHEDHALFASLPGAGPRLAPRLLAEWGDDRTRYASAASLQVLAGTAPVAVQSGAWRGVRRRTACVNSLRQALYHFAHESTLFEPWAKAYYVRKRVAGKTRATALRALGNVWLRILYAMWRTRTPYDPAIYRAAQLAHGRATG